MYDSIVNAGEFLSDHWLAEAFPTKLTELSRVWKERDVSGGAGVPQALASAAQGFERQRIDMPGPTSPIYADAVTELHRHVLTAAGFDPSSEELATVYGDQPVSVPLLVRARVSGGEMLHVLQARPVDSDDELLSGDGLLLDPVVLDPGADKARAVEEVAEAVTTLFQVDDAPRFVVVIAGNWLLLTDAARWAEGRYLAFDLETAFARRDTKAKGELAWHAGLWSADVLLPPPTGESAAMAAFSDDSVKHAVGVSEDLREGLRRSVELIANEALAQRRAHGLQVEGLDDLPAEITAESLRFLYRILFLLFAEARPELGILPVGAPEYGAGYGIDRLRDLIQQPLSPQAAKGHHFHDSLDLLFGLVNNGHGHDRAEAGDGLVFEPLKADLFSSERLHHIDSIRMRNDVLQQVLELLLLSKGSGKGRSAGYISYAQLGINQLGAVYEGLMAYTGFVADQDLVELAKDGDPTKGTWMVPAEHAHTYDPKHVVMRQGASGAKQRVVHKAGSFVYRLAGRDRQRSASYYTPEILTRTVVRHALAELIDDDTEAADILSYRVCEPALGSGAFANEAINQLAAEYLHRRQKETEETIDPGRYQEELQRVKAFLALHRVYGIDLNATAVELAEVSMWLNVMHPGLQAPWFGLHLRRGNSLIGARRATYDLNRTTLRKKWSTTPPQDRPLAGDALGPKEVHHFLLPAEGWGAACSAKEAKELAKDSAEALRAWSRSMRMQPTAQQVNRLIGLAQRVERLWALTARRMEISEYEIARTIGIWNDPDPQIGGGIPRRDVEDALADPDSPYQRLRLAMDAWCALYFWPVTEGTPQPPGWEDWIGTLERLLGVQGKAAPVDQLGLHDLPNDFHELGQLDEDEAGWYGMASTLELLAKTPWLAQCRSIAQREAFFHWELDFAQVFVRGGFDLQVGNPPWVRLDWKDDVTLAEYDPAFGLIEKMPTKEFQARRSEVLSRPGALKVYLRERAGHAGLTEALRSAPEHEVLAGLRTNLYMSFMERVWRSAHPTSGVAALLHPESHFADPKAGVLRSATYRRLRRHWQFINEGRLFEEVHNQTEYGIHVYGPPRIVRFQQIANLLYPDTLDASLTHNGEGEPPGIKLPNGDWDLRPHKSRVIDVNERVLEQWAALFDEPGTPALEARLLRPIVREHLEAIGVLADYPRRMSDIEYYWSSGWNETLSVADGFIEWDTRIVDSWREVILQGPHFFVATPLAKQPNQPCRSNRDYSTIDLEQLPGRIIPRTNYQRACDWGQYVAGIPRWSDVPATHYWRLAWRDMTQPSSQRTLISAVFPPGPSGLITVPMLGSPQEGQTIDIAALWSSLPMDFLVKITGKGHIQDEIVRRLPAPEPWASSRLRALTLNAITSDYEPLWQELWEPAFAEDSWTHPFTHLRPLGRASQIWEHSTPLRTDEERRAALVEIDALAALMLGLSADHLVAMYTGQMAVLRKYESRMWFDANGRAIAQDNAAKGAKQRDQDFRHLQAHLVGEPCGDLLDRYTPPFRQPDREAEMRAAYAEFQERLGIA
jgi:hypothetical protein